jgi:serine protease Do
MQLRKITAAAMAGMFVGFVALFLQGAAAAMEDAPPAVAQPANATEASKNPCGQPFEDPQAVSQHFADELGRLKEQDKTISPEKLIEQAVAESAYPIKAEPDPGKTLESQAVYAQSRPGVVVVGGIFKCTKCQHWHSQCATGFVVRRDGLILTNFHVVESMKKLEAAAAMTDDGRVFPLKAVLSSSRLNDLALLKVDAENLHPLPVSDDVAVGATVYCLSHPVLSSGNVNGFYTFSKGMVCNKFTIHNDKQQAVRVLGVIVDYGPGSSGGPILNEHGAVVAMACQAIPLARGEQEKGTQLVWRLSRPSCSILELLNKTVSDPKPAVEPAPPANPAAPAKPKPAAKPTPGG